MKKKWGEWWRFWSKTFSQRIRSSKVCKEVWDGVFYLNIQSDCFVESPPSIPPQGGRLVYTKIFNLLSYQFELLHEFTTLLL